MLLWDPWAPLSPGVWLSFGAVGLLLYAGTGRIARASRTSWRSRLRRALGDGARTQWIVTIGLVPGTLALFQQVSLVAALANAFAIPMVTLAIVPLALAGIALPIDAIWHVAHALTRVTMALLDALAAWPSAVWSQHAPRTWTVVVATAGVLLLLAPRGVPGRAFGCVLLLPMFLVVPAPPAEGAFRLTALDVGQGLAVVIETSRHAMVYDSGPRFGTGDAGQRIVAPFLRAAGIRRLDTLVISHQDVDHAGGAMSLLQTVAVAELRSSLPADSAIVARAAGSGTSRRCAAGQSWEWDGVRFSVLFPPLERYAEPGVKPNDLSCVVRIDSRYGSALLTGDIEARGEADLLRVREAADLRADLVVVPHHGSRTSSTPAFVAATAPRVALFAVGYRNRFGHPRPDVVSRYAHAGAIVMRSDHDGAVAMSFGPNGGDGPIAERERRKRYWFDPLRSASGADTNRPSRTAVSPFRGRRVGMMSTHSSYGVLISASPSRASSVPRRATTCSPCTGSDELEAIGGDRHDVGDFDGALRAARSPDRVALRAMLRGDRRNAAGIAARTASRQRARRAPSAARIRPAARSADRQDRRRTRSRAGAFRTVCPSSMTMCSGNPDVARQLEPFPLAAGERQRRAGVGHRMQVEQVVGGVVARAQLACALELARRARPLQHLGGPQPVEVLVEAARRVGIGRIEGAGRRPRWRRSA